MLGLLAPGSGDDPVCRTGIEASDLAAPCRAAYGERTRKMEIVIAAAVLAVGLVIAARLSAKRASGLASAGAATATPAAAAASAKEVSAAAKADTDDALARRQEMGRLEERLISREEALEARVAELDHRERSLEARLQASDEAHERHVRELERVSGLSASQAKHLLLKELGDQIRHDSARLVRQIEEQTKRDAERRVRNILAVVMQRLPPRPPPRTTGSVLPLPPPRTKGRLLRPPGRHN